jgi:hypothetical protein
MRESWRDWVMMALAVGVLAVATAKQTLFKMTRPSKTMWLVAQVLTSTAFRNAIAAGL